jgi:hypothetical protein
MKTQYPAIACGRFWLSRNPMFDGCGYCETFRTTIYETTVCLPCTHTASTKTNALITGARNTNVANISLAQSTSQTRHKTKQQSTAVFSSKHKANTTRKQPDTFIIRHWIHQTRPHNIIVATADAAPTLAAADSEAHMAELSVNDGQKNSSMRTQERTSLSG